MLSIIVVILIVRIVLLKRAIRNVADSFMDLSLTETNVQIQVDTSDKNIRYLAASLNNTLKEIRSQQLEYLHGNNELENAIVSISHDLRTPLTAINGYLTLLETEEKSEEVSKYLDIISERMEVLQNLTEELFRYSVVTTTIDDFNIEETVLNSELETSLAAHYGAFVEKNIIPEVKMCDSKVIRNLDKNSLQRILSNVISNAIKYSEGDFYVELKEDGELIFMNQTSIQATDVGRLFNRFFTVESAHHSTGLGLSIAKLLTEKNGGTISASLRNGKIIIKIKF